MRAGFNNFNDGAAQPGTSGAQYGGYFDQVKGARYDIIYVEGVAGDVVRVCQDRIAYGNYAGDVVGRQGTFYSDLAFMHPATGKFPHYDYIETYVQGNVPSKDSTLKALQDAKSHGSAGLGLIVGDWFPQTAEYCAWLVGDYANAGVKIDTIVFWAGYGQDIIAHLKPGGKLAAVFAGLKSTFGVSQPWVKGTTPGPTPTPTPNIGNPITHMTLELVHGQPWLTLNGVALDKDNNAAWWRMTGLWRYDSTYNAWKGVAWVPVATDGKFSYVLTNLLPKGHHKIRIQTNDGPIGDITQIELY